MPRLVGPGFGCVAGEHRHNRGGVVGSERSVQRHVRLGNRELAAAGAGAADTQWPHRLETFDRASRERGWHPPSIARVLDLLLAINHQRVVTH
jgi:triphosphoribosyl-dephospho-CoA synthetase